MSMGRVEASLSYVGDEQTVRGALNELIANLRQRALTSQHANPGSAASVVPWAEAVLFHDDGTKERVAAFHIDPDAPDADAWAVVDDRLPHEPGPEPEEPEEPEEPGEPGDPEEPPEEPEEYPEWQPWSGHNEDLWQVDTPENPQRVRHNGQNWRSIVPNNHWEPGSYGWEVIP